MVGEVESVDPEILNSLERDGFIPVISPVGVGSKGEAFNINADYVASAVASALKAEKLILLTDVPGIKDKKDNVISSETKRALKSLLIKALSQGVCFQRSRHAPAHWMAE